MITEHFGGRMPRDIDGLLRLPGVGRKTANLVLGLGFGIPAICVDTHVHRISNRLGWVRTANPEETETALRKVIARRSWIELNTILVTFGQNICVPVSPWCSRCPVRVFCRRIGVEKCR
jgi:endonuclease-3